jgi:hypothetical protein
LNPDKYGEVMNKSDKSNTNKKTEAEKTVEEVMAGTESGKIWDEIKNKSIDMFALPDQKVHQYCQPKPVDPSKLYLVSTATSVLPSLETAIGKEYEIELANRFMIVTRAVKPRI